VDVVVGFEAVEDGYDGFAAVELVVVGFVVVVVAAAAFGTVAA
jgi:hypothetical protein